MKNRPHLWLAVSLVSFAAAVWLWRRGEQWEREHPRPLTNAVTNSAAPAARGPQSANSTPSASASVATPVAPAAPSTAPAAGPAPGLVLPLRNSTQSVARLLREPRALLFRNAFIDTRVAGGVEVPAHLKAGGEVEAFVVQAANPADPAFRRALAAAGATVASYIPNNALLVHAAPGSQARLAALPQALAVLPYEPFYKLDPELVTMAANRLEFGGLVEVAAFPGQRERLLAELDRLGVAPVAEEQGAFGTQFTVPIAGGALLDLARHPAVHALERHVTRTPANDLTRPRLAVSTNSVIADNYLGLTGQDIQVVLNDTGVAPVADLAGRVTGATTDSDGHGTHIAGIIAGDGSQSGTIVSVPPGSATNANFRGMAPGAKIFSQQVLLRDGPPIGDVAMQALGALAGGQVINNSWSYGESRVYDSHAASYDAAVRDSLPWVTGEQAQLIVFSAGNSGFGQADGLGGVPGSINSPGVAKNVITVGAIENLRNITNEVYFDPNDTNAVTKPFLGITDSDSQVASFSSRGNVGRASEGIFGRFKPDVVAPGTMVISSRSPDYQLPAETGETIVDTVPNLIVAPNRTNIYAIAVPDNAISLTIQTRANANSPNPFPLLTVRAEVDTLPGAGSPVGSGSLSMAPPALRAGTVYYQIENLNALTVDFDLRTVMVVTNTTGNYYEVYGELNAALGPNYRYESGTSMSAGAVSGILALMQEFYSTRLGLSNSPAMMKALLINGSRSSDVQYSFATRALINFQGWGLPNITNCAPRSQTANAGPLRFFDVGGSNSLATGESHTYQVTVDPSATDDPLRLTLVWTDPPGNPIVSVKLVNNLDLIVTNLDTGAYYVGNYFGEGSDFSGVLGTTNSLSNTNNPGIPGLTNEPVSLSAAIDVVNNVENVFIRPPLGARYSVTVRGTRVSVNAVNSQTDAIRQDYALVVGSANTGLASPLTVAPAQASLDGAPLVVAFPTNGGPILNQRAGAQPVLLGTQAGQLKQWNFYTYTNPANSSTNLIFATFIPPNLTRSQRTNNADIDLYVSQDPNLTNLAPAVLASALKSLGRGGNEQIVISNAAPGAVFYVGVKSEDQQAAQFALYAILGGAGGNGQPNEDGDYPVTFYGVPAIIPDGTAYEPGGITLVAPFSPQGLNGGDVEIQRIIVTNTITSDLSGDIQGTLSLDDTFVVLNNHRIWSDPTATFVYDDSDQDDIDDAMPTDGPGSLNDFVGQPLEDGTWFFTAIDSSLFHTSVVDQITMLIQPTVKTNDPAYDVYLNERLGAGRWLFVPITIPTDATNLTVCVAGGPAILYVRKFERPTIDNYDYQGGFAVGGECFEFTPWGVPALVPGRYFLALYNPGPTAVDVHIDARILRDLTPATLVRYVSRPNLPLLDDAVNFSSIVVPDSGTVADLRVGFRIAHERASDLVIHLISPSGKRLLLAENRGTTNELGYGAGTNLIVYAGFSESTNLATTPIKFMPPPFTNNFIAIDLPPLAGSFEDLTNGVYSLSGQDLDGWWLGAGTVAVVPLPLSGTNSLSLNGTNAGAIHTSFDTTAGSTYRLIFHTTRHPGLTNGPALVQVYFPELGTNFFITNAVVNSPADLQWSTNTIDFTAPGPRTSVALVSRNDGPFGMLMDDFIVVNPDSELVSYQLAEEPLKPFFGEDAEGPWTLEVLDNRLGAANGAVLLAWELELGFTRTNRAVIPVTPGYPATNVVVAGADPVVFVIEQSCLLGEVTVTLQSSGSVSLTMNQDQEPGSGAAAGDLDLGTAPPDLVQVIPVYPVPTNSVTIQLQPGPFYLAVQNISPTDTNTINLSVDFQCSQPAPSHVVAVRNLRLIAKPVGVQLEWQAPAGRRYRVEYANSLADGWQSIPVLVGSADGNYRFHDTGMLTGGLSGQRFYRLIQLP